jgi:hypothetical protein
MKTRKDFESLIQDFAELVEFVDLTPGITTHLGRITMLDNAANLLQDKTKVGTLQQLTNEEFNTIYTEVRNQARKILATAVSK